MSEDSTAELNPTTSGERIEMIDALRGFALTGVCLANLSLFSFYFCLSDGQKADLPFPLINTIISYVIYFFVDQKFWTLFSILFGFGASVFISRANNLNRNGKALYARRLLLLLLMFGLIHCIFFWFGDILAEYALAGFILLLFITKKGVSLAVWGIILGAFIPLVLRIIQGILETDTPDKFYKLGLLTMDAYSSGPYSKVIIINLVNIKTFSLYVWFLLIAALGRFMLGYWIGQTGIMYQLEKYTDFLRKTMRICAWTGFPIMFIATIVRILTDSEVLSPGSGWESITYFTETASLAIGLFYAINFALLYQDKKWKKRLSVFKEMGRMAFTNYLMQTIILIPVFNGIGFGLAGNIGPSIYIIFFVFLMIMQIIFSKWWLSKYRFGPFEWLWRSLTYKKLQPMKY